VVERILTTYDTITVVGGREREPRPAYEKPLL
jgi:hypothetical protein